MAPLSVPTGLLAKAIGIGLAGKLAFRVLMPIKRWQLRRVPGSTYKPFVGDALEVAKLDFTGHVNQLCRQHSNSPICKFFMGAIPFIVVREPQLGKELLLRCDTVTSPQLVPWAPAKERQPWELAVPFLNGEQWFKGRKAIEETAHATALAKHAAGISKLMTRFMEVLDRCACDNRPFNAKSTCTILGHNVIVQAMFGTDTCSMGHTGKEAVSACVLSGATSDACLLAPEQIEDGWWDKYPLHHPEHTVRFVSSTTGVSTMYTNLTWAMAMYMVAPRLLPLWRLLVRVFPDKNARLQLRMIRGIRAACLQLIRKWKAEHLTDNHIDELSRPRGLMSYVFFNQRGHKYSEQELVGIVLTSLFGGFETTGATLAMCLFYMAKYPEVQKKAQQEVDQVLGGKEPGMKDVNGLPYISALIMEVLRLCAPIPGMGRRVGNQEYVHPGDAFRAPKHTKVWIPLHVYHRDPSIWPRAHEFRPERHIQPGHEDLAPTDAKFFFPFGAGSRRCPGQKLALLENKLGLARLLQRFDFHLADGYAEPVLCTNVAQVPDHVMLKVSKRI